LKTDHSNATIFVMASEAETWDMIIIGGGPAGSLAGLEAVRRGRRCIILEKAKFPRFHVGESFLPATLDLLKKIGLEAEFRKLPHTRKFGAEFCMGSGGLPLEIDFADGYCDGKEAFNIERSIFDNMLLREAAKAGVSVREELTVRQIGRLTDGDVEVVSDSGEKIRGRYLLDASGQGTVIGRHLGTKVPVADPNLQKVAYAGHFEKVILAEGKAAGNPVIVMMDEGWFWIIPLSQTRTSVGMVLGTAVAKKVMDEQQIPADRMLQWGIANCPVMKERMQHALGKETNAVVADFSYKCEPYAGAGYFLIGDSAAFMDPIFSTGVCVASQGALSAVGLVDDILNHRIKPGRAREIYIHQIDSATRTFFKLIGQYYDHSFRELFMQGKGPLSVHRALIGLLAGNVFPKTPWKIRWRTKIFDYLVEINRKRQIVPRRRRFSIFKNAATLSPAAQTVGASGVIPL
jgi:flavin-dependent dehydrogenase